MASTDIISVKDISLDGRYFDSYYLPDQKVTYFYFYKENSREIVFFNADGAVMGAIEESPVISSIGNTFVTLDGYYRVDADRVGEKAGFEIISEDVGLSGLKRYYEESRFFYAFYPYPINVWQDEPGVTVITCVMLHEGVWKKLSTEVEHDLKVNNIKNKVPDMHRLTEKYDGPPVTVDFSEGQYLIRRDWFDQQKYIAARSASFGSPTGRSTSAHWQGRGYYSVHALGDQVRFSFDGALPITLSGDGPSIYMHDDVNFIVLSYEEYIAGRHRRYAVLVTAKRPQ